MKRYIFAILFLFFFSNNYAQVGIGTITPTASLEILGSDTGAPVLELNPQSAPVGSATGQLAVIGDLLYMYDATRIKWLSIQSVPLQFSRLGTTGTENLFFGNTDNSNTGPIMPFDGTIVAVTAKASAMNSATKRLQFRIRNGTTNISNTNLNLNSIDNSINNIVINNDFSAGDYLAVRGRNSPTGSTADDVSVVIWVKWRK